MSFSSLFHPRRIFSVLYFMNLHRRTLQKHALHRLKRRTVVNLSSELYFWKYVQADSSSLRSIFYYNIFSYLRKIQKWKFHLLYTRPDKKLSSPSLFLPAVARKCINAYSIPLIYSWIQHGEALKVWQWIKASGVSSLPKESFYMPKV